VLSLPSPEPTAEALADLERLREALDASDIPDKRIDRNLLIATWNIRAFGALTETWASTEGDEPRRDLHALLLIAAIVDRFDVIAIQEVKANSWAILRLLDVLGPEWGVILSDATRGDKGNGERLAFVFDSRRVQPSGLACELVLDKDMLARKHVRENALSDPEQFARTPYAVSFRSVGTSFTLTTLHVVFGDKPSDRIGELSAIAEWVATWAKDPNDNYNENLIVLGDFNIEDPDDPTFKAFREQGLRQPAVLDSAPRTIFDKPGKHHHYDQIAWFEDGGERALTLDYNAAGFFNFTGMVLRHLDTQGLSWRLSDHIPLWAEFLLPELDPGAETATGTRAAGGGA